MLQILQKKHHHKQKHIWTRACMLGKHDSIILPSLTKAKA